MINLFSVPNTTIDLQKFDNLLHDSRVNEFEDRFSSYVGFRYGLGLNSASSAIFLLLKVMGLKKVRLPNQLPPTVLNYVLHTGAEVELYDNEWWVGNTYKLGEKGGYTIIDSAQEVTKADFPKDNDKIIKIYSFYPTKPVGGIEGGMICCNDKYLLSKIRELAYYGGCGRNVSWEKHQLSVGYKMYMTSLQAYVANKSLDKLADKRYNLDVIKRTYRERIGCSYGIKSGNSYHLYRVYVEDVENFIRFMNIGEIQCGIHYKPLSEMCAYRYHPKVTGTYEPEKGGYVSIPLHENLTSAYTYYITGKMHEYRKNNRK
jgi:dTDP-4-amino-4,6-dideoxygalactose transaminase